MHHANRLRSDGRGGAGSPTGTAPHLTDGATKVCRLAAARLLSARGLQRLDGIEFRA